MNSKPFTHIFLGLLLVVVSGYIYSDKLLAKNDEHKIVIVDRDGREWDITHAVKKYNMNPDYFNFGIGVGAIPSVDDPIIVDEDSSGYPRSTSRLRVLGVDHNGEQRAYSVDAMIRHEIFNETYPGESKQHVAVGYWTLADLAVVYSREIDGRILHLAPSGWTYGKKKRSSVFVLMDKETESLWFPMEIEGKKGLLGISGVYKDRLLPEFQLLSPQGWFEWKKTFPGTRFVHD